MSERTDKTSLNRRIFSLAIPAIFNNITVPLLGISDTTIAGHLGSASFLAAMAVGAMMLNVIFWLCGFLRMGTTGLSSQAYGASDYLRMRDILRKSLSIAVIIGVAAIAFQRPLERLLFRIIAPDPEISGLASSYFRICLWGAPAQLVVMAVSGWFIGMQNTVVPMIIAVGVNIVNILLSVSLVFVFDFGFTGVAAGTLTANWLGVVAALLFMRHRLRRIPAGTGMEGSKVRWSRFFSVNTDLFFRSACIMCVTLAMTAYGSRLGETTLAANAVIMQFFLFFSYFMDGFAFAGEAIVGSAAGARDHTMLRKCVLTLLGWGAVMALLFFTVYFVGSSPITGLLTDAADVRSAVGDMRVWLVIMPPVTVAAFIFDGVFIGMARTRALLFSTIAASAVFFCIVLGANVGFGVFDNHSLWTAFETYLLLRGVLLGAEYVKLQRKSLIL